MLALAGTVWLIHLASTTADAKTIASVSVYGVTLVLLYTASTLYHSVRGQAKNWLRTCDHLSIYLLIAGSYTPFCLISLQGTWGWSLFGLIWALAMVGMLQEWYCKQSARIWSLVIYAVMGWLALIATQPLLQALGTSGFAWLLTGGLLYSIGVIFYVLDERVAHFHGVWHLFVLAGSSAHFVTIWRYVIWPITQPAQ